MTVQPWPEVASNFCLARKIIQAYYPPEEFILGICYAPLGFGKSSYTFKNGVEVLQRVYHMDEKTAWERLKELITFHPSQFFGKIDEIEQSGMKRIPFIIWEDMGLWLFALDFNNPFIESVIKYLNVARTHLAAIIGSTPSPEWVLRKLRRFPSAYTIRISKLQSAHTDPSHETTWKRVAIGYSFWLHADLKHSGVRKLWEDTYAVKMPDEFFQWYKPLRDSYEDMALALVREKWERISKESKAMLLENYPNLTLPKLAKLGGY